MAVRLFDFAVTRWVEVADDNNVPRVEIQLRTGSRGKDPLNSGVTVATLTVRYQWAPDGDELLGRPRAVSLAAEGLTPTEVARFAWTRWMRAADAVAASRGKSVGVVGSAIRTETAVSRAQTAPRRPGPRGNVAHDVEILERWEKAQMAGLTIRDLADELGQPRNTVKSWIDRARKRVNNSEGIKP